MPCPGAFVEDPEKHLGRLGISLPGIVTPDQPASLEPASRTAVNGHFFWASSPENTSEFRSNPQQYTGQLLDPVTHEWFLPNGESPRRDTPKGILLFSSSETAREFDRVGEPFPVHWH